MEPENRAPTSKMGKICANAPTKGVAVSWPSLACVLICLVTPLSLFASAATAAPSCAALARLALPGTKVTAATLVAAGDFQMPVSGPVHAIKVPDFCRVQAIITPTIHFEVWLPPAAKWNGKLEMIGQGSTAGDISYAPMAGAVERGFAAASSDTGHVSSDVTWMHDHERLVDWGYRAIHETAVRAKSVIAAFYKSRLQHSYFTGCSGGGRDGYMEAQRYPADFDGIVAGAPGYSFTAEAGSYIWMRQASNVRHPGGLSPQILQLVQNASIAACDEIDGVKDGLIEDPHKCKFDPGVLQCTAGKTDNCLVADQVAAVRDIYAGAHNPRTGQVIMPGYLPGGESYWAPVTVSSDSDPIASGLNRISLLLYQNIVFNDPKWDWKTYDFDSDQARAEKVTAQMFNAEDTNLSSFRDGGGKLLVYQGYSDPIVPPDETIGYYERVAGTMKTDPKNFFRLFMIPGMTHCHGGADSTDTFDAIDVIDNWVTRGQAPDRIVAVHVENGTVTRARPLCPYPQVAHWNGVGSADSADSFTCVAPAK